MKIRHRLPANDPARPPRARFLLHATALSCAIALAMGTIADAQGEPASSTTTTPVSTPTTPTTVEPTPVPPTTTTTSTTTTVRPTTTSTTTTTTTTTTTVAPTTSQPRCAPPTTTTTTTTTTTLHPTTTTTTTVPDSTTTTTTTTTLPPCPTTTTTAPPTTLPPPSATPGAALGIQAPQQIQDILLTIRLVESGQRYHVPPNRGGASGAYQYIDSTWNNYSGYPQAYLAPAHIQDERALADVQSILATWRGDVSMVPVIWYYPAAATNVALLDRVPMPSAGNRLTVREYQRRWLDVLAYITGTPSFFRPHAIPPNLEFISGRPPVLTADDSDAVFDADAPGATDPIAFPVLGHTVITPPITCDYEHCSAGTSAAIFGLKLQPVLAAVDGVITSVQLDHPATGTVGLTLTARDGRRFVYAGLNDDTPGTDDGLAPRWLRVSTLGKVGTTVYAGQIIGFMGDSDPMPGHSVVQTGEAVWPHIRLTAYAADGTPLDTDLMVLRAQSRQACHVGIGPWSVPPDPDADRSRDDAEIDAVLNGKWTVHGDGRVTAVGRSTLIMPPENCVWAPTDPFGPGAAGNTPPFLWGVPFGIPAEMWVADALSRGMLDATTPMAVG